jgi:hypothetical protein
MPNNTHVQPADTIKSDAGTHHPLANVFAGNDGGAYYVIEVGGHVYWFAEHPGRDYAHVFHGTRKGNKITGSFYSVPKDTATSQGQVTLEVLPNGSLKRVSESGGFPAKSLSPIGLEAIKDILPGERQWPGFTANSLEDLDGVFTDGHGLRLYVRQAGHRVALFAEKAFTSGELPALAVVFVGERNGSSIKGEWAAVPKGKKTGSGPLSLTVKADRSLLLPEDSPLGEGILTALLPDIPLPISTVMDLCNGLLNKVKVRLDQRGSKEEGKSYVELLGLRTPIPLPDHFDGILARFFINDMVSDVIHIKPIAPNETRLTVVFEEKGTELVRVGKVWGFDRTMADWEIEYPRCDVYFKLVERNATGGRPSISYEVLKVELLAEINAPGLVEKTDDWVTSKARPKIETMVRETLNLKENKQKVADALVTRLDALVQAASGYKNYGFLLAMLVPKRIFIEGNNVVFSFK